MKRIAFCLFIVGSFFTMTALAVGSPMVERHIFSPEPDGKGTYKSPMELQVEKDFEFTGVIISPQGKWAIIRERANQNAEEKSPGLHKEGDEIKGMTIREIGSNYLILSGEGKNVKMALYEQGKTRPPASAESQTQGQDQAVFSDTQSEQPPMPFSDDREDSNAGRPGSRPFSKPPGGSSNSIFAPQKDVHMPKKNPFEHNAPVNPFMQQTQTNSSSPPSEQNAPFPDGNVP